jgi:hypothetical protein
MLVTLPSTSNNGLAAVGAVVSDGVEVAASAEVGMLVAIGVPVGMSVAGASVGPAIEIGDSVLIGCAQAVTESRIMD